MTEKIEKDGVLYAIIHRKEDWADGLNFLTPDESFIQVGTFWYDENTVCGPHKHRLNKRPNDYTQECNIVMMGQMEATIYDNSGKVIHRTILSEGDMIIVLAGGHGYKILKDYTRVIECKNGPFISVEADKVAL